jgi:hypothetical protein
VREVRQRCEKSGHQSAILCTDYQADLTRVAIAMFARWCQENFFKYMREHYSIDRLIEYGTEALPHTTRVVNPAWREVYTQIRRHNGLLQSEIATFGNIHLTADLDPAAVALCEQQKGTLRECIAARRTQIAELKARRKALPKHILIKDLPEEDRFSRLRAEKRHFIHTIKLIAYRAETAMAQIARETMARLDDARALMRQLYRSEVDLIPDHKNKTLTVRLTTNVHDQMRERIERTHPRSQIRGISTSRRFGKSRVVAWVSAAKSRAKRTETSSSNTLNGDSTSFVLCVLAGMGFAKSPLIRQETRHTREQSHKRRRSIVRSHLPAA